jgi:dihydrofolate synthase/folylpolyglutamate synthase
VNYQEALAYLYSLSDFERSGAYTRSPEENLPREARLLELLGSPQQGYTCTLIAGTKGKGSTAALIERVLRQAGVRTGLYTQPDLHTFRERMRVNGNLISEREVAELLTEIRAVVEAIQGRHEFGPYITYEVATALALLYFRRQRVQHAVLEVGLGGRLDATNVTQPLVSVITSISYDHIQILGNTLTEIATEKAGIVKPNGVVVTSAQPTEALLAIAAACQKQHARLVRVAPDGDDAAREEVEMGSTRQDEQAGRGQNEQARWGQDEQTGRGQDEQTGRGQAPPVHLGYVEGVQLPPASYRYRHEEHTEEYQRFTVRTPTRTYSGLEIPLRGRHQLENAAAALATLDMLREQGIDWDETALREGLRLVRWPARIEVVGHKPTIVVDGAHNADSMQKLVAALRDTFTMQRLIVVLSPNRDKDLAGIARALAGVDAVVLTRMANPRAATIAELQAVFAEDAPDVTVESASDSTRAMELALDLAGSEDLICATGSLYLAAEVLRWSAARGDREAAATIEGVDH